MESRHSYNERRLNELSLYAILVSLSCATVSACFLARQLLAPEIQDPGRSDLAMPRAKTCAHALEHFGVMAV